MSAGKRSGRPGGEPEATENASADLTLDALDAHARLIDGAFVVLLKITPPNRPAVLGDGPEPPKYRRRVFLSAAAAERAVRAAAARGETCRVFLAELKPLHLVRGWEA